MWIWPEGESRHYIPRGGYSAAFGTFSSIDDITVPPAVNVWCDIESTLVERAFFALDRERDGWGKTGQFFVELLSGARLVYPDASLQDWRDFIASPSHGTWLQVVYFEGKKPYEVIREATKKVTREMKDKRDIGVKVLDERPTVRPYLRSQAYGKRQR